MVRMELQQQSPLLNTLAARGLGEHVQITLIFRESSFYVFTVLFSHMYLIHLIDS
jgi:hypothetical protein